MQVLYTHYLTKLDIGANGILPFLGVAVFLIGLFWILVFKESGSKANFICMICLIICGLFLLGLSELFSNIKTDYIDYKEVIFNDDQIDLDLLKNYTIIDVKGDIYTIEPIKQLKEEKQNDN